VIVTANARTHAQKASYPFPLVVRYDLEEMVEDINAGRTAQEYVSCETTRTRSTLTQDNHFRKASPKTAKIQEAT
jgi:hypothetical protein